MDTLYKEITLNDWDVSKSDFISKLSGYIYRGQSNSSWGLSTSMERCLQNTTSNDYSPLTCEYWLTREFKRRFHLYSNHLPGDDDLIEWISIMQHHGAPTRLLDFTYSFYVALFFAINDTNQDAAVWAIKKRWLWENVRIEYDLEYNLMKSLKDTINNHHVEKCNEILKSRLASESKYVIPVEPEKLSERMSRQQGLFVMPTSIEGTFSENISNVVSRPHKSKLFSKYNDATDNFVKIVIPERIQRDILQDLTEMNINYETLFPGIDGFAKSLQQTVLTK